MWLSNDNLEQVARELPLPSIVSFVCVNKLLRDLLVMAGGALRTTWLAFVFTVKPFPMMFMSAGLTIAAYNARHGAFVLSVRKLRKLPDAYDTIDSSARPTVRQSIRHRTMAYLQFKAFLNYQIRQPTNEAALKTMISVVWFLERSAAKDINLLVLGVAVVHEISKKIANGRALDRFWKGRDLPIGINQYKVVVLAQSLKRRCITIFRVRFELGSLVRTPDRVRLIAYIDKSISKAFADEVPCWWMEAEQAFFADKACRLVIGSPVLRRDLKRYIGECHVPSMTPDNMRAAIETVGSQANASDGAVCLLRLLAPTMLSNGRPIVRETVAETLWAMDD